MFLKRIQDEVAVSWNGETESFRFGATELAHIVSACAWPGSNSLLLTAARTEEDKADVVRGRRGNYRAYAASAKGLQRLTDEYTNSAIPLPNQSGLAFSNGGALVIESHGQRRVHKVGRFNWGSVSLSCNEAGNRIALTKWKGDNRKLAYIDLPATELIVSRFSYHSYILMGDEILYVLGSDVMCYSPASGKSRSLTPRSVLCELLDLVGVGADRLPELEVRFASLSLFNETVVVIVSVQVVGPWEWLWHGMIRLPYLTHPMEVLLPIERPWCERRRFIRRHARLDSQPLRKQPTCRAARGRERIPGKVHRRRLVAREPSPRAFPRLSVSAVGYAQRESGRGAAGA